MKDRMKSFGILLVVLLISWLVRLFAGDPAALELVKKIASVTWNS